MTVRPIPSEHAAAFDVELPMPPSLNGAYFNLVKGGRAKTESYSAWSVDAVSKITQAIPMWKRVGGPVSVSILLPKGMRGDVDNRIKPVLDALVKSGRIDDDRNVVKVSAAKELVGDDFAFVSVREAA